MFESADSPHGGHMIGSVQSIEQEPGPRGSPQVPHGPGVDVARDADDATANVESNRSSSMLLQLGHAGTVEV